MEMALNSFFVNEDEARIAAAAVQKFRQRQSKKITIRTSYDLAALFDFIKGKKQEVFIIATLNSAHEVIKTHIITKGLVNQTQVHPREVFRHAITDNAVAIACAHNHPGGSCEPSEPDKRVSFRLKDAGEIIGIHLLDSLVVSKTGYSSILHEGA